MIVSIAIAVLPVWRSPMISSRWPRPIGIIESIAFSPVSIGSLTGWRWTTPGALCSAGRVSVVLISPLPSSGLPSGSTIRPEQLLADRDLEQPLGPPDRVALDDLLPFAEQHRADVVGLEVQRQGGHVVGQLEHLERHAVLKPVDPGDAVGDREHGPDLGEVGARRVEALDSALEDGGDLVWIDLHEVAPCAPRRSVVLRLRDLLAKLVEAVPDRGVEDEVADSQHEPAEDVRIDLARELDLADRSARRSAPRLTGRWPGRAPPSS